jgi:endonuclease III-like uncharacterized protein
METKPELKQKYKKLIRDGKSEEAEKVLNSIRDFGQKEIKKEVKEEKKEVKKPKKKEDEFDFLLEIKGIGKETLEDIKKLYPSLKVLKQALKDKKVPLRNDVVKKLAKNLLK